MTRVNDHLGADGQELTLDDGRFLIEEGLDLLAAYRSIKSDESRRAILTLIASIAEAELQAECRGQNQLK